MLERGFLSACNYRRTSAFVDWMEEQRIVKRSLLRRAALSAWEEAEAAQEWSRARRSAEVLLNLDPREETILRRVMRARVLAGQVREAEAVYRAFAERVDPSGGQWTPERATTTLLRNVQDLLHDPIADSRAAANRSPTPPLVGRRTELTELTRSLFEPRPNRGLANDRGTRRSRCRKDQARTGSDQQRTFPGLAGHGSQRRAAGAQDLAEPPAGSLERPLGVALLTHAG